MSAITTELVGERSFGCYTLTLTASSDKLCLYLTLKLTPDCETPPPSPTVVQSLVSEIVPTAKISKEDLRLLGKVIDSKDEIENHLIATGTPAIPGRAGRIVFLVKKFQPLTSSMALERVDHRFIRRFDNIEQNTVVLRRYPAESGIDGLDVFGVTISAIAGAEAELKFDASLELRKGDETKAFEELIAMQAGYLDSDNKGILTIRQHLAIDGDVDSRTGDIEFIGSVSVSGSVMKDYSVIARGDVKVEQDVVSGTVISQKGSIIIGGNVSGSSLDQTATKGASSGALQRRASRRRPQIKAKGKVQALSLDEADVEAGEEILISGDIRNCYIRTHQQLQITEGSLLGGKTYAVRGIEGSVIGSPLETITQIFIVNDLKASARFAELQQQLARHRAAEKMLRLYLGPYHHHSVDVNALEANFRSRIVELRHKLELTRQSIAGLEGVLAKLLAEQVELPTFQLNFSKSFHAGSEIIAEDISFSVDKELIGPRTIIYNSAQKMFGIVDFKPLTSEKTDE